MKPIITLLGLAACSLGFNAIAGNISSVEKQFQTISRAADGTTEDTREWVEVTLETPGSLGVEILYKVDVLADVKHLRVTGTLNDDDWTTLNNIRGLQSLDLSNALATAVPDKEFQNHSALKEVILPSNLTSIGQYAFAATSVANINIPASVTSIGNYCFQEAKSLTKVTFDAGSALTSIGEYAFYRCSNLTTIAIPNGVKTINQCTFNGCRNLSELTLPASLVTISSSSFCETDSLKLVDFPETLRTIGSRAFDSSGLTVANLPLKLSTIGNYAFRYCRSLTDLVLPGAMSAYEDLTFYDCSKLTNITCPCAVPPTIISSNTFYGVNKRNATLHVPEFAKVNYKLDSFWLGFGTIVGDATADYWEITGELTLTNSRRIEGTPDIHIASTGKLTVGGTSPMEINNLSLYSSRYSSSETRFPQLISNCPAINAANVSHKIKLAGNYWHFISFPYDVKVSDIASNISNYAAIRYYDGAKRAESGTGYSWKNVAADDTLKSGKGYILMASANYTLTFPAVQDSKSKLFEPNAVITPLDANTSSTPANAGWNLVGNPYQCYYDMYYTMLTCPVTLWDTWNRKYVAYSLIDDDCVLQPNQAFFIQASETLSEIEFGTLGRQFSSTVSRPASAPARMAPASKRSIFNVSLNAGELFDETRVVLNDEASAEYESNCDASKFFSDDTSVPQLYTVDGEGNMLAINELPETNVAIPLGFYAPASGEMSIAAPRADGTATLHDALTGKDITLTEGNAYTFNVAEAGHDSSRFSITFVAAETTGIADAIASPAVITAEGRTINVSNADSVAIYTADGRTVVTGKSGSYTVEPGIYIVKAGAKTAKCIIK